MSHFTKLAQQILTSNDQHAYTQMTIAICDLANLESLLNQITHSNDLCHFIYTQLLTKNILAGQFCPINETKSDDNNTKQNSNEKTKLYSIIIPRVYQNICLGHIQKQYIVKSALNLISVCLKDLCDNNKNLSMFINLLENCLFPSWKVNQLFTSSLNGDLVFLQPPINVINYFMSQNRALEMFQYSAKILIQLIQYVTMVTVYKTYYEYRRNIYTFRNTYLPTILNVATDYHKILHRQWKNNMANSNSITIINALAVSVSLVEKIIAYPFSLTIHQFEAQDQNKDSVVGLNSDIYFPTCFRNVLCDRQFLDMMFEFFFFLIKELSSVNQLGDTVYCLIRIVGRIVSASIYTFNSEDERKTFRTYCLDMVINLLFNFKFFDSFYIFSLSDIFCKVLNAYTTVDLQDKRQKFYEGLMFYCETLVQNCQIKLQDGKRNPFNRLFDIVVNSITESKETMFYDYITLKSQQILNKAFTKLYNWEYAQKIMNEFGKNQKTQIQCFQQLFQHISIVFSVNLDANLNNLMELNVQSFAESQQTIWLHLCAVLLPNHLANRTQTQIILKFFKVAQQGNNVACLHYIQVLINQVLYEMQNGLPSTCLWTHISQIQACDFTDFVLFVLNICKKNFEQTNTDLIDYALQVFKSIYMKLKKHSANQNPSVQQKFNPFYNEVKQLIGNLSNTVFESPKFFKRRVQLFSVISTIWINADNYKYLEQIYNLVSSGIKQDLQNFQLQNIPLDPTKVLKYMHDMRGILQPIDDSDSFKIICQLAIQDLTNVLPILFNNEKAITALLSEEMFLKAFCKMILQFVTDYARRITHHVQTQIPFLIHDLFKPYLLQIVKFDYPKCMVKIWQKFSCLHPLQEMLPLIPSFRQKDPKQFNSLIKQYFENIHRVELNQLESLYPYIEDKVEYLCQWWQQVIRRKLYPNVSLRDVVESRIATTKRQKQQLAKLIFYVGTYSQKYWDLKGCNDERLYVKWFLESYKDFKE